MNDYRLIGLFSVIVALIYWSEPLEVNSTMTYLSIHGDDIPEYMAFALLLAGLIMIFGRNYSLGIAFILTVPLQLYLVAGIDNVRINHLPKVTILYGVLVAVLIYRYLVDRNHHPEDHRLPCHQHG